MISHNVGSLVALDKAVTSSGLTSHLMRSLLSETRCKARSASTHYESQMPSHLRPCGRDTAV